MANHPLAVSYVRFSHPKQAQGDSYRRQTELSEQWAKERGLTLAPPIFDKGVSAYHGTNATKGNLASFLQLVEKGRVPRGSFLIVEQLDRLSRQEVADALPKFLDIINAGITVVTLNDRREYTRASINANPAELFISILAMTTANQESAKKSQRVGEVWAERRKQARENNRPIFGRVPSWMELADGKLKLIPERAAIVREMFKLSLRGHGCIGVAKKLNARFECFTGRSKKWSSSTVELILKSRACIGEYQPRVLVKAEGGRNTFRDDGSPIRGYYPAVVDERTYYAAQQKFTDRRRTGGRTPKTTVNIFRGLLTDVDGKALYQEISGPKRKRCYISSAKREGGKSFVIPADEFDAAVLFRLAEVLMVPKEPTDYAAERDAATAKLSETTRKIEAIKRKLVDEDADVEPLADVVRQLEARRKLLAAEVEQLKAKEAVGTAGAEPFAVALKRFDDILHGRLDTETRTDIRNAAASLLERIVVYVEKEGTNYIVSTVAFTKEGDEIDIAFRLDRRGKSLTVGEPLYEIGWAVAA